MMGLDEIKKANADPEAYYKSQLSSGQEKGQPKKPNENSSVQHRSERAETR